MDIALDLSPASPNFNDLKVVAGDLALVGATDDRADQGQAILQNILQTLRIFLGEWFMDLTVGIDYFNQVLVKNPDQSKIDAIFISKISRCAGVQVINSYSFTPNFLTRQLSATFKITTTQGIVSYQGILQP